MAADTTESDKPVKGREGTEHLARDGAGLVRLDTRDLERRVELGITRMGHSPQRLESLAANCVGKNQAGVEESAELDRGRLIMWTD